MKLNFHKIIILGSFLGLGCLGASAQTATVSIIQDKRIPELLALKSQMTKDNELKDRYKIQLYYGEMAQANAIYNKYLTRVGEWPASIEYETPNYKVWVGNFSDRLQADRALLAVQKTFPNAFVLKPER
ncbi:MAG: SPOR domain-containing protein [Leeuwenhoekiella sp.]